MAEIVTTGGVILDNVVAADGAVHLETLGGNAVYSAAGARLWAGPVAPVGVVPANYPDRWLRALARAGLDTAGIHRAAEAVEKPEWFFHRPDGSRVDGFHAESGALAAFGLGPDRVAPDDARRFEAHLRETGTATGGFGAFRAAHPVEPAHVPPSAWAGARGLHLAPNRIDAQRRLAERARTAGLLVSLDPGGQARVLADGTPDALLRLCDAFLPSEKELAILCPGDDPETAVRSLAERGPALVVAKLGAAGALLWLREAGSVRVPALAVPAPDPTGAGDAFCGGFLAGLVRTGDPVLAACCGTVSASFAVEDFGPFRLLAAGRREAGERLRALLPRVPGGAVKSANLGALAATET